MIEITKNGNVSVILFTDSDYYLFDSGQILAPLGSLTMVLDKSDMVTFRKAANNDLLFSAKLGKVKINGTTLTKQNAQSLFDAAMGGSGSSIRFEEVQQLPATGENGVIYLVPNGDNTFTEWVWLENEERFEKLGYDVDLSDYYTKTEVDTALAAKQNTLTFDNTPTENSTNPVTSGGIYTALQNVQPDLSNYYTKDEIDDGNITISAALNELHDEKQDKLTFDSTPTEGSSNPVTSNGIVTYLLNNYYNNQWVDMHLLELQQAMNAAIAGIEENYQPLLEFDSTPTENSENPVTSGGIYNALQNVQPDMSNYYDKDEIDEGNRVVSMGLNRLDSGKADKSDTYTKTEVDNLLDSKQDALTFDTAPTQNSTNPVTSGGLYNVLGDIETALTTIIGSNS